jgi:hypothetical protein
MNNETKIKSHEDLLVWKKSMLLVKSRYKIHKQGAILTNIDCS